jgi:hypothetical protein
MEVHAVSNPYVVLRHMYNGLEVDVFLFVSKKVADDWVDRNRRYWKFSNPHYESIGYRKPRSK